MHRETAEWKRLLQIIDAAYDECLAEMRPVRRREVAGVRRKLRERKRSKGRAG